MDDIQKKFHDILAVETLLKTEGWKLFLEHLREEQTKFLKKARDKRIQFSGDKIALFMACEGALEELASWPDRMVREKEDVAEEIKKIRNR